MKDPKASENGKQEDVSITVIVPTFREVENLPLLVPRIVKALVETGLRHEILVVDDNSRDGTEEICQELALSYPVRLEVRTRERGLSSAVLHGMRMAHGSVLVVIDADLSHPPEKIPELIDSLLIGEADFAIGSRYVQGGGADDDWGLFRRLNSKIATMLAWPLTPVHDPMAGFFAIRRSTFEAAAALDPIGYKIGLELIVKCKCKKIKEIPITFRDRLHGTSKLTFKEQIDYLRHLKRLYEHKLGSWGQLIQFVLVGGTGMAVDLCAFLLLGLVLPELFARAIAIFTAMTWNFGLHRQLAFSRARSRPMMQQYLLFCASCFFGAATSWLVFFALYSASEFFHDNPLLTAFFGILSGAILNFLISKNVAFR